MELPADIEFEDSFLDDDVRSCRALESFEERMVPKNKEKSRPPSKIKHIMQEIQIKKTPEEREIEQLNELLNSNDENAKIKKIKELS